MARMTEDLLMLSRHLIYMYVVSYCIIPQTLLEYNYQLQILRLRKVTKSHRMYSGAEVVTGCAEMEV